MLETKLQLSPSPARPSLLDNENDGSAVSLAELIGAVRRQLWILLLCAAVGLAIGAGVLYFLKPNFVADATLLIDTRKYPESQSAVVGRMSYDLNAAIDSLVQILKSREIALAVVKKLQLADDPEFAGKRAGVRAMLLGPFFKHGAAPSESDRVERALAVFDKHLTVKRVADTFALDIAFESKYADRAAEVANATAEAFINDQLESQNNAARQASDWLEERIRDLGQKSVAEQRSVAEYETKNDILDLGGGRLAEEQRLSDLSGRLETARAQETDARVKLEQWDRITAADPLKSRDPALNLAITDLVKDETIAKVRTQYMDASSKYAELSTKLGPEHPALVNLRAQMQQIRTSLPSEFARLRLTLKGDYDLAQERVKEIQKELSEAVAQSHAANMAQATLRQLKISAQTYQNLYDTFLHRYTDALQEQKSAIAAASVISPATPPAIRNYNKLLMVSAIFPLLGLGVGGAIGFLRECVNRAFWTSWTVQSSLHLPCISIVPKVNGKRLNGKRLRRAVAPPSSTATGQDVGRRTMVRGDRALGWYAIDAPFSRYAEALRAIKLAVDLATGKRGAVIGFTSALPNEGKSTVALGFALLAARGGARVILVDCDLRNPSLTKAVAPGANAGLGLVEVLTGRTAVENIVFTDPSSKLDFLPTVQERVQPYSADILAGESIVKLFEVLRANYDFIVVDLSPLAPIVDASATTQFVDNYVLIVEWGKTKVETVIHTLRSAPDVYNATVGVVLNKADIKQVARYDSHLSGYYYTKYDTRYGLSES